MLPSSPRWRIPLLALSSASLAASRLSFLLSNIDSRVELFGSVKYSNNPPAPEIPSLKNPFTSSANSPTLEPVLVGSVNPLTWSTVTDPSAPVAPVTPVDEGLSPFILLAIILACSGVVKIILPSGPIDLTIPSGDL